MPLWPRQQYIKEGLKKGIPQDKLERWLDSAHRVQAKELPALLSLSHLAEEVGIPYRVLREIALRTRESPYRTFHMAKRRGGWRTIAVPEEYLLKTQRWLCRNVLSCLDVHPASSAYRKGNTVKAVALKHCESQWLIKIDVESFFESISERQVFRIFSSAGYPALVAFELARLCTAIPVPDSSRYQHRRWKNDSAADGRGRLPYSHQRVGHLPQGAPTSPKLSNLVMLDADRLLAKIAEAAGCRYSRYADDLIISTKDKGFSRDDAVRLLRNCRAILSRFGFRTNTTKVSISPPGARKLVLGLLVDGDRPRLNQAFRNRIENHLYGARKFGPQAHATARGFSSVLGLRRHIEGLLAYANYIDSSYAAPLMAINSQIKWPL